MLRLHIVQPVVFPFENLNKSNQDQIGIDKLRRARSVLGCTSVLDRGRPLRWLQLFIVAAIYGSKIAFLLQHSKNLKSSTSARQRIVAFNKSKIA